ncbi:MAG: hypothetical protein B6245_00785 [Desulfobacteraceae bacterium 4572_88]|nr:MAG: hypothetical protein B6245_00785 [Desulfobacteraceae bacterium 4572_88]
MGVEYQPQCRYHLIIKVFSVMPHCFHRQGFCESRNPPHFYWRSSVKADSCSLFSQGAVLQE